MIILLTACNIDKIDNTPKKKVEEYLYQYQTLSDDVLSDLNLTVEREIELDDYKNEYIEIMKNNFKNMTYVIKDEMKDGDKSNVEVEITVNNFVDAINDCKKKEIFENITKCKIEKMKKVKEKIKYTIYFIVKKDINNNWQVEDLSEEDEDKLLGVYTG